QRIRRTPGVAAALPKLRHWKIGVYVRPDRSMTRTCEGADCSTPSRQVLELVARADGVARSKLVGPHGHARPTAEFAMVFARQVDAFQQELEVLVDVVRHTQVELAVVVRELRASAAALVGGIQELVAPVV